MSKEEQGRYLIAQRAQSQAAAHYLPGAWGGVPGGPPVLGRSVHLNYHRDWDHLRIHAGSNSLGTCYGRWAQLGGCGYLFQPGTQKLERLKQYVAKNQGLAGEQWPHFENYGTSPRRLGKPGSSIAMAEDCRNRRHFDCIGFIFWTLNEVMPWIAWWQRNIPIYAQNSNELEYLGRISGSQLKPGDIVVRTNTTPKHIGIALGPGSVIHASREGDGVLVESFSKGNWTGVSRVRAHCFG